MKRVLLFVATNLAILIVLGFVLSLLGIDGRSTGGSLLIAAVFGMGGSFISLAMSKWIAKSTIGARVIEQPRSNTEIWLMRTVQRQAQLAAFGISGTRSGLASLFMSHPPLEKRIVALKQD